MAAPTRQQGRPGASAHCPHCGAEKASARHLFAECPHYDTLRAALQQKHGLDDGWWARQPRVTAKSGWVTYGAARTVDGRVHAPLATNCLGIRIVEDCWRSLAAQEKHDRAQHH